MKRFGFGKESVFDNNGEPTPRQKIGAAIAATLMGAAGIVLVHGANKVANDLFNRHNRHTISAAQYAHEAAIADREQHHVMPQQPPTPEQNVGGTVIASGLEATSLTNPGVDGVLLGALSLGTVTSWGLLRRSRRDHELHVATTAPIGRTDAHDSALSAVDSMLTQQTPWEPEGPLPTSGIGDWMPAPEPSAQVERPDGSEWYEGALSSMDVVYQTLMAGYETEGTALHAASQADRARRQTYHEERILAQLPSIDTLAAI